MLALLTEDLTTSLPHPQHFNSKKSFKNSTITSSTKMCQAVIIRKKNVLIYVSHSGDVVQREIESEILNALSTQSIGNDWFS